MFDDVRARTSSQNASVRSRRLTRTTAVGLALTAALSVSPVWAVTLPTGGVGTVPGGGTMPVITPTSPTQTDVDVKDARTIIDWTTFDVPLNDFVNFHFGAGHNDWTVFNRVAGGSSQILGTMQGCLASCTPGNFGGNIWLYARDGVMFGGSSVVNTGGLMATTADLTPAGQTAYLGGASDFNFSRSDAAATVGIDIKTGAEINGLSNGVLAFIAPIVNSEAGATVTNAQGDILYGAAQTYEVKLSGVGNWDMIDFIVSGTDTDGSKSAAPLALGASSWAKSGNVYMAAVTQTSVINAIITTPGSVIADSATVDNGNIVLSAGGGFANSGGIVSPDLGPNGGVSLSQGAGTYKAQNSIVLGAKGNITLNSNLNATTTSLTAQGGDISQAGGLITATTVTGLSTGSTTLGKNNLVDNLNSFKAGTDLTFVSNKALSVTTAEATTGTVVVLGKTGALTAGGVTGGTAVKLTGKTNLVLNGDVSGPITTLIAQGGNISQPAGLVTATTLTGSSTGATTLGKDNLVDNLTGFTAGSDLTFVNNKALTAATVTATTGTAAVTTKIGKLTASGINGGTAASLTGATDLTLSGIITAPTTTLTAQGGDILQTSGVITATTNLSGSSTGKTTLAQSNLVDTLSNFTAGTDFKFVNNQSLSVATVTATTGALDISTKVGNITAGGVTAGSGAKLNAKSDLILDGDVTAPTVYLIAQTGDVSQTGGIVSATTLTGSSAGSTTLNKDNLVTQFSGFTAGMDVSVTNNQALSAVNITATAGTASVTTKTGSLTASGIIGGAGANLSGKTDLLLTGNVTGPVMNLVAGTGDISQAGAVITATTLGGSSGGKTTLTGVNVVDNLTNFTAGTDLSFLNSQALSATNVTATTGAIDLTTSAGGLSAGGVSGGTTVVLTGQTNLALNGNVSGPSVTLTALGGDISQSAGIINAPALTGSSTGKATLGKNNLVDAISNFTAATDLTFVNNKTLSADTLTATAGTVAVTTKTGALTATGIVGGTGASLTGKSNLILNGNVTGPATTLAATDGAISQAAGIVTATTVGGSSGTSTTLDKDNLVGSLNGFTAGTDLTFVNNQALSVVNAGAATGTATITSKVGALTAGGVIGGTGANLISATDLTLNGDVNAATTTLTAQAGDITQSGGVITATTKLTGSSTGQTVLGQNNLVDALQDFTAGTDLTFVNNKAMSAANVTATAGAVVITTKTGALTAGGITGFTTVGLTGKSNLILNGDVTAPAVTLTAQTGNISQTGGIITTPALTGSSGGSTTLDKDNLVDTLSGFTAGMDLTFVNNQALMASGITATGGTASITTKTGGLTTDGIVGGTGAGLTSATDLVLNGDVTGPVTSLVALGGDISQAAGIVTATTSLSGSSSGSATLDKDNLVAALNNFTAGTDLTLVNNRSLSVATAEATTGTISITTKAGALSAGGVIGGTLVTLTGKTNLTVTGDITSPAVVVTAQGGDISQSGGVIKTPDLTGSATGNAALGGDNEVVALHDMTAGGSLTFVNNLALSAARLTATTGTASVTTKVGDLTATDIVGGTGASLSGKNNLILNGDVTGPATSLTAVDGDISQVAGIVTAGTLGGSSGGKTALGADNLVDTLSGFAAGTDLTFVNNQALSVAGATATAGTVSITTKVGGLTAGGVSGGAAADLTSATQILLNGNIAAPLTTLTAQNGNIAQSSGAITAATLTGTATGQITLDKNNKVDNLSPMTAAGDVVFVNDQALSAANVTSTAGAVSITTKTGALTAGGIVGGTTAVLSGKTDLMLNGNVTAPVISLIAESGNISQTGGIITTPTLGGTSGGSTTLGRDNLVGTLSGFTAGSDLTFVNNQALSAVDVTATTGTAAITTKTGGLTVNGVTGGAGATLTSKSDLVLNGDVTAPTTILIAQGGDISQTAGIVTAATRLSGSSTGKTTLDRDNLVNALSNFTAGTDLRFINNQGLSVATVEATTGTISITTKTGALSAGGVIGGTAASLTSKTDLVLNGDVTAPSVDLVAQGGDISQTNGIITTPDLSGSSTGKTALGRDNLVSNLNNFTAGSDLTFVNNQDLSAATVTATTGTLAITTKTGALTAGVIAGGTAANLTGKTDLILNGDVAAPTITLNAQGGQIRQDAGILVAATLTGASTQQTTLAGDNLVGNLNTFAAGTDLLFYNNQALSAANVTATAGSLVITTKTGGLTAGGITGGTDANLTAKTDLVLNGDVSAPTTTLTAQGGDISQTGGIITAATLTGSSSGSTTVDKNNLVGTLSGFTAGNDLTFVNNQALTAANVTATAGTGAITTKVGTLTAGGIVGGTAADLTGKTDLILNGDVTGQATTLTAQGGEIRQDAGIILATSLTGSSTGSATLGQDNLVGTLQNFTAGTDLSFVNNQALNASNVKATAGTVALTTKTDGLTAGGIVGGTTATLTAQSSLVLSGNVSAPMATLTAQTGDISQSGGVIAATTLNGSSAGSATLDKDNLVANLSAFTAGADLTFVNNQALNAATVTAMTGTITISTKTGALSAGGVIGGTAASLTGKTDLVLNGDVSGPATILIAQGGDISQTAGVITAGTLGGSSTGKTTLARDNLVTTLSGFTAGTDLTFVNDQALIAANVAATTGTVAVTTKTGDLILNGNITAPTTSLVTQNGAIRQDGGIITSALLTGSSTGKTTLAKDNLVTQLSNFAAGSDLTFVNNQALSAATVAATTGTIAITTKTGALSASGVIGGAAASLTGKTDLVLTGDVTAPTTTLVAQGGDISQTGGVIKAATLSGSSAGKTTLNRDNLVSTLSNFKAGTDLTFVNNQALTAATVEATVGAVALTTRTGALTAGGIIGGTAADLTGKTDLILNADVTAPATTLTAQGGDISQTGGVVKAGTLTGSSTGKTTLTDDNLVDTLSGFTAATDLTFVNNQALSAATVSANSGTVSVTTKTGALTASGIIGGTAANLTGKTDLILNGDVTAPTSNLVAVDGNISQPGGIVLATTLMGSSGGSTTLGRDNLVTNLNGFTAGSDLTFVNNQALKASMVKATAGTVYLTTKTGALTAGSVTGGAGASLTSKTGLILDGDVTGPVTTLVAQAGDVSQTGGVIAASTKLTGSSTGKTTLDRDNLVASLQDFTSAADLTFINNQDLSVANVAVASGPISVITKTGTLTAGGVIGTTTISLTGKTNLTLNGDITAPTSVTVTAQGGDIGQTGGAIKTALLTGTSTGKTTLDGDNLIDTLNAFTAGGDFSLKTKQKLTAALIASTGGSVTVETKSGGLLVNGPIAAAKDISLKSAASLKVDMTGKTPATGSHGWLTGTNITLQGGADEAGTFALELIAQNDAQLTGTEVDLLVHATGTTTLAATTGRIMLGTADYIKAIRNEPQFNLTNDPVDITRRTPPLPVSKSVMITTGMLKIDGHGEVLQQLPYRDVLTDKVTGGLNVSQQIEIDGAPTNIDLFASLGPTADGTTLTGSQVAISNYVTLGATALADAKSRNRLRVNGCVVGLLGVCTVTNTFIPNIDPAEFTKDLVLKPDPNILGNDATITGAGNEEIWRRKTK